MASPAIHAPVPAKAPAFFLSHTASETAVMARLLAIADPDSCSDVSLAQCVASGLRPAAVTAMAQAFGGDRNRIIGPIVPEATFRRAPAREVFHGKPAHPCSGAGEGPGFLPLSHGE